MKSRLVEEFTRRLGRPPALLIRSPGRVNLIGEHTDYNDGFVLPMAIDRAVWIALRPRPDAHVRVHSLDFCQTAEFDLGCLQKGGSGWAEYLKGVAAAMQEDGFPLRGWEGVLSGDVPIGAGLSSSAALEMAAARAFAAVAGLPWEAAGMARLCQRAENRWVGVRCGIMDPMVCGCARAGHALFLDCRSLEAAAVPLPPATVVAVLDTTTRRGLADSAYNERRAQCEAVAKLFGQRALRDLTEAMFQEFAAQLDTVSRRRARHVITENSRTVQAADAMRQGDAEELGRLMNASHESLREDFEVSSPELDAMVECARAAPGCLGARMTGAGFGGCAVALVRAGAAEEFFAFVAAAYCRRTCLKPQLYLCRAANGAEVIA